MAIRNLSISLFVFTILCVADVRVSGYSDASDRPHNFIVYVARSQKPSLFTSHHHWYASIIRSLPPSPHPSKILYTYDRAVSGFSARITAAQASKLRDLPGVLSVYPDQIRQIHTTHTPRFLGLADGFGLWPNSDYADDVIVGVLDTGISPDRPSFSDEGLAPVPETWKGVCETGTDFPAGSCNRKIIGARAFYRGYEAYLERPMDESKESKSARDTEGHGTHTASTAAGSVVANASFYGYAAGEARGMATKARIAAYKICWDLGCFDSDILAAFDQAVGDGVHVISLSVGTSGYAPAYDQDSISIGAFGAAQHGVFVSCSAGNSGPGAFTAVNVAPWILTVGASTVDREFPADAVLGDGRIFNGVSLYSGEPLPEDTKYPLVYGGDCGSQYCYSGKLNSTKVAGKIVICDRGGNARVAKGSAVKLAGGIGLILANTPEIGEELIADAHLIPATTVGAIAGAKLRDYARLGSSPTATIKSRGTVIGSNPSAPKVASFSSRGPNYRTQEILKPDIVAPGVNILAGWTSFASPTDLDIDPRRVEFNIISGTSMACPHASGLAALLRNAYPDWSPAAIKSALMTTAYNVDNSGNTIGDLAGGESTPFVRGAGHVDPNRALNPGLIYDIDVTDYVSFLCSIEYTSKQISIFTREPASEDACAGALANPGDLNYPSFSVVLGSNNNVVTYKRTVKNVGSSVDAVYEVKVNAPVNVDVSVSPTKLVFSEANRTLSYEITFSAVGFGWSGVVPAAFGSVEWTDGSHSVRSPIAVKWKLANEGLSDFM